MLVTSNVNCSYENLSDINRDEQGYIDLTGLDIDLDPNSREKVGNEFREKNWVKFSDGRIFLLKEENIITDERNASVYAELIVEELAKQAGIETAHYDLYKKDGKYGVLSEYCLKDNEEMFSLDSLIGKGADSEYSVENVDSMKLQENMIEFLKNEGLTKEQIVPLIIDFQKRMVFDLFTLNADRHTENISFRVKNQKEGMTIDFAPMYDNENSLMLDMDEYTINSLLMSPYALKSASDFIAPKIAFIESPAEKNDEIWKKTLDKYLEIEEIYDYTMDLYDTLDIDKAIDVVEKRINAKIPENAKGLAKKVFTSRKREIDRVMCMDEVSFDIR